MVLPSIQLTQRDGIIDLSWGHPDPTLLPVEAMQRAAQTALATFGADALAYGADRGNGPLLAWLRERIGAAEGRLPSYEQLTLTGGISQALDQVCTLCTQPGDVVLVESPTYHLAVRILRDHPLELLPLAVDHDGLRIDTLESALADLRHQGRRTRMLYTIPTFHNPTGVSLSAERRRALVALAADNDLLIVEDDVYRELAYDTAPPPSLWSLAPDTVIRLGSFAKTLAPGVRLGWLTAPAALVDRFIKSGVIDSGGGVNHFAAMVVAAMCASGDYDAQVTRLCNAYRSRRDHLLAALAKYLPPDWACTTPGGGFFAWVRTPLDTRALLPLAEAHGVSYLPGSRFYLPPAAPDDGATALRMAFTLYSPDELAEAARRLGMAAQDMMR